jgi:hypothetical protein
MDEDHDILLDDPMLFVLPLFSSETDIDDDLFFEDLSDC